MERSRLKPNTHHKLVSEMTREEHFLWNEEKRLQTQRYRARKEEEGEEKRES